MSKEYHYNDLAPFLEMLANTSTEHEKQNVRLADYLADLSETDEFEEVDQNTIQALSFALGYLRQLVENRKKAHRIVD